MKKIILISILLCTPVLLFSQPFDGPPHRMREKLSELEKIKLIETLKMDEETTLKFFSRRTEHQTRMDDLAAIADKTIDEMETMLKGDNKYSPEQLKSLIDKANSIHSKMEEEKTAFINSLGDILTTEQIAKLIIFERRFKDELRRVLFRDRKHMNRN
jgi:ribosomal protein S15P/S13E